MESVLAVVSHVVDVRPSRSQIVDTRDRDAIIAALHDAFGSAATAARRAQEWLPAPQPISLDKRGLKSLRTGRDDYLCTLKADGSRFVLLMLMIDEDPIAVMVSRKLEMYEVPLVAQPHHFGPVPRTAGLALAGTVLDGELVHREDGLKFLVFDAIVIDGRYLRDQELTTRMTAVYRYFEVYNMPGGASTQEIEAMAEEMDKVIPLPADTQLQVVAKRWWVLPDMARMWHERAELGSPVDGIVFMRRRGIVAGTDRSMFKWKSSHTVDVCLGANAEPLVAVEGQPCPADQALSDWAQTGRKRSRSVEVSVEANQLVDVLMSNCRDGVSPVVECEMSLLSANHVLLVPVKERPDKTQPNDVSTVALTMTAAKDAINITALRSACDGDDDQMVLNQAPPTAPRLASAARRPVAGGAERLPRR
jgi:hypothetical protein